MSKPVNSKRCNGWVAGIDGRKPVEMEDHVGVNTQASRVRRTQAGAWQTASTLIPSGSSTNAP